MYLLTVLGLCCCEGFPLVVASRGCSFVVVHGILTAVASFTVVLRLQGRRALVVVAHGLSSCGSWALEHRLSCGAQAWLLCSMLDLPGPGIEPMSPALTGRFFTTEPSGKPYLFYI